MKKRRRQRIFGRKTGPRKALLISVARSLVLKEKIKTTEAKAKETSPFVEKLITKAKKGDLSAYRHLRRYFEPSVVKKMIEEIGTISLDAIFTPIRKVSYRVENMRVGERTNFDRLTLEIETDGTMDSEEALRQAASILIEQYTIVFDGLEEQKLPRASKKAATKKEKLPLKKAMNKITTIKAAAKK